MKKLLRKTRLGVLVLLGFVAFGFGVTQASAQLIDPTGLFKDADVVSWTATSDAETKLQQEIGVLETKMLSAPDDATKYKIKFYHCIMNSLESGETVPASIDVNYVRFVAGFVDAPVEFPNTLGTPVWESYYEEVALLLKN